MLSSSLDTLLKVSKTTYPKKLFAYDCVTLQFTEEPLHTKIIQYYLWLHIINRALPLHIIMGTIYE